MFCPWRRACRASPSPGSRAAPAFAAEFVTNGKFTAVTGNSSSSFFLADGQGDVTGWTTSTNSDSNNILFASPTDIATRHDGVQFGFWSTSGVTSPPGGGNFVSFDGDPQGGAQQSMMQTISGLTIGDTYTLSFEWAATQYQFVNGPAGDWTGPTSNAFQVSLGGETQETSRVDVESQGFTSWMTDTMTFTAASASEVLRFVSDGGGVALSPGRAPCRRLAHGRHSWLRARTSDVGDDGPWFRRSWPCRLSQTPQGSRNRLT